MDKIYHLIIKHPIQTAITVLALVVPYTIAILKYNWRNLHETGFITVAGVAIAFSLTPILLWAFIYWLSTLYWADVLDEKEREDAAKVYTSWEYGLAIVCGISAVFNFIALGLCFWFEWSFKVFVVLTYFIPLSRILILPLDIFVSKKVKEKLKG